MTGGGPGGHRRPRKTLVPSRVPIFKQYLWLPMVWLHPLLARVPGDCGQTRAAALGVQSDRVVLDQPLLLALLHRHDHLREAAFFIECRVLLEHVETSTRKFMR